MTLGLPTPRWRPGGGSWRPKSHGRTSDWTHQTLLKAARVAWVAVALVSLGSFVVSLPLRYLQLVHGAVGSPLGRVHPSSPTEAIGQLVLDVLFVGICAALALLIFRRKPDDWMALLVAFWLITWAPHNGLLIITDNALPSSLHVPALGFFLTLIGYLSWMLFFYLFPSGGFAPRWFRWLAVVWAVVVSTWNTPIGITALPPPVFGLIIGVLWASFVVTQVYRYVRISMPRQREQTKWVVLGIAMTVPGCLATFVLVGAPADIQASDGGRQLLSTALSVGFVILIPLSITVAILRSRLFDIDTIINRALVYGSSTVTLGALYLGGVLALQALFRALTNQDSDLAVAIATLTVAGLFNPWRRRVQTFIDRHFYRRKYDAARILADLQGALRDEVELDRLSRELVHVVHETVQPTRVSLWLR